MLRKKFQKGLLITSSALLIFWFAVMLLTAIFRTPLLGTRFKSAGKLFLNTYTLPEAAMILGGFVMLTANFFIYGNADKRKLPLILSSIAAAVVPLIFCLSYALQYDVLDTYEGETRALFYAFYKFSYYHRYMLSVYQQTAMPESYIFYAGAAAAVINAAVYAFGGSSTDKAVRVSQTVLALGVALQILLYFEQKKIIGYFTGEELSERIVFYPAIVACLAALGVMYAAYAVSKNKGRYAPLIGTVSALALLPFLILQVSSYQSYSVSRAADVPKEYWNAFGVYSSISISLFYFIYVGMIIAASAAAVKFSSPEEEYEPVFTSPAHVFATIFCRCLR